MRADIRTRVEELQHNDWQVRERAADGLAILGQEAVEALPALRRAAAQDSDYDVREHSVRAIGFVASDVAAVLPDFETFLSDSVEAVRRQAADTLAEFGPKAAGALELLWARFVEDSSPTVQQAMIRAIQAIDPGVSLVDRALELLGDGRDTATWGALTLCAAGEPTAQQKAELFEALWRRLRAVEEEYLANAVFARATEYAPTGETVVERLIADEELSGWKRSRFALMYEPLRLDEHMRRNRTAILELYIGGLEDTNEGARDYAAGLLADVAPRLSTEHTERVVDTLRKAIAERGTGLLALSRLKGPEEAIRLFLEEATPSAPRSRALLIDGREVLVAAWEKRSEELLPHVLIALDEGDTRMKKAAADFLGEQVERLPAGELSTIEEKLQAVLTSYDTELRGAADVALIKLRERKRGIQSGELLKILESGAASAQLEAIERLLALKTPDASRALVREWARWVALSDHVLVEFAAEKLRRSPAAVLPLVDQLDTGLELYEALEWQLRERVVPREYWDAVVEALEGRDLNAANAASAAEWLETLGIDAPTGGFGSGRSRALVKHVQDTVRRLVADAFVERQAIVAQRLSRQLADMSDGRFFDSAEELDANRVELRKHAVLTLGRRLANEEDTLVREHIARTLGNIGSREAVDILARAIVGEERTRERRQKLLADYYLEPSKQRSDEASKILHGAVHQAKRTLQLIQALNVLFFLVGLGILVAGVWIALTGDDSASRIAGGTASLGGFITLAVQIVREPLVRIQNAVNRLVQVETAFASFIWELNLNGTYIQSQYVHEGILTDDEIAATVDRIEGAMQLAMDLVTRYADEQHQPAGSRITRLVPAAGPPGTVVSVYGSGLKPVRPKRAQRPSFVAVDHAPLNVDGASWTESLVRFTLPTVPTGARDGGLWISLVVDGEETNALPFRFLGTTAQGNGRRNGGSRGTRKARAGAASKAPAA
jgi:HEAT repeat protein